jgi:DNA-binding NarL/FixJ family response regulator/anti-sigma regulatory factor (Ser/Thr protein kinase)
MAVSPTALAAHQVRVMVVDDNAGFRESLLTLLDTEELRVVGEARTGEEALELVQRIDPDVVLMDVRMPTMDGIEATRRLKELRPGIGVVALTGHEDQAIVREMLVAGASGYVLKDSDGDDILQAVMQAALGGAVLSPTITPTVIDELTEAFARERRRTRELEEAHAALVQRAARRHELVSRLGHELRTPVTVVLGMAQTLSGKDATPAQREELLQRLMQRATELARLVERFEIAVDADLTERVDVVERARAVAEPSPRVRVVPARDLPKPDLNPLVATRILEELIDNALRFSSEDSAVRVEIARGLGAIEVRITDRGPGVAEVDRDRIFEPLEQVEVLNIRTHQGAGLGLSLARTAARAMDGDVVLERSGPRGSTFLWTISLETTPAPRSAT